MGKEQGGCAGAESGAVGPEPCGGAGARTELGAELLREPKVAISSVLTSVFKVCVFPPN